MTSNQAVAMIIRDLKQVGSGRTEVFHVDAAGAEHRVRELSYTQGRDWSRELTPVIQAAMDADITTVILDLVNVAWINSTGVAMLVRLQRDIKAGGGETILANVQPRVARVFEVTTLDRLFVISGTLEEAVGRAS